MRKTRFDPVDTVSVREEITYTAEDYLRRVRNRFISTLERIGEENFRVGYERLSRDLAGKKSFTYTIEHEFVRGMKRK
jgi:HEAT repeat protein